uniref:Transmembrane protein n=1 Tax=Noccaea caerulescens TaxID=107243 RepID=A0A1J3CM78_NOCCA
MNKVEMATATTSAIRAPNWRKAVLFWTISLTIFYSLFQMGLRNSPSTSSSSSSSSSDHFVTYTEQSTRLYDKMEQDLQRNGPVFLKQGETSQSLSLSDLFTLKNGNITPVLKVANPPVRANVLHLSTDYSVPISRAVKNVFGPYFENTIWFQDSKLYHFSMFHASHHIISVPATEDEVEAEAAAVNAIANELCPLEIILDRVLLTSTGVLLGCWKVNSGDDPVTIRSKLRSVLPRAPEKQLYDAAILHTSLARLLGPPISLNEAGSGDHLQLLHELVAKLNNQIQGFKAIVSELWYVEEFDLLALALGGRMKIRSFKLGCAKI